MLSSQVSGVGNRQSAQPQSRVDDEVHQVECISGHALIGGIVEDESAAFVRRNNLSRKKVF